MRPVTKRRSFGFFAGTEPHFAVFFNHKSFGPDSGSIVRTITKRMFAAAPAGTPEVFSLFQFDLYGFCIKYDRFFGQDGRFFHEILCIDYATKLIHNKYFLRKF